MSGTLPIGEVNRALEPVASALGADGYLLSTDVEGDALRVRIAAGPEACADCLVSRSTMSKIIATRLAEFRLPASQVRLEYPGDA